MVHPVINEFGNTYEKKAYHSHSLLKKVDPLTGEQLTTFISYDNMSVKNAISHYLDK